MTHGRAQTVRRHPRPRPALVVAAVGVVFGDIGTSPLYAFQAAFSIDHAAVTPDRLNVLGICSLIFWSVALVVSVKYVGLVMRADNDGQGGIIALSALAAERVRGRRAVRAMVLLGIVGAALFYGDSLITPAISVLSAVEGLRVATPGLAPYTVEIAIVIIVVLFAVQHRGTARIGRLFGPVMLVWFAVLATLGILSVIRSPEVLAALSPSYAVEFWLAHPWLSFIAMGAVVLAVTGAEALYADMGHFGRPAISRAWYVVVFPALVLNYFGQGANILRTPAAASDPFFLLAPGWLILPLVVLATMATVIASQAVISGAFSMTQQAMRFGHLPRMRIRYTSESERGQIYVPVVNWTLLAGVIILLLAFGSSTRLSAAYGLAVTGTFTLTTVLLMVVARTRWGWPLPAVWGVGLLLGTLETVFLASNSIKILSGGWLPVVIAGVVIVAMTTWRAGRILLEEARDTAAGSLDDFLDRLRGRGVFRQPGTAIILHSNATTAPLALRRNIEVNGVLHDRVLVVDVQRIDVPYVDIDDAVRIVRQMPDLGLTVMTVSHGFMDRVHLPSIIAAYRPELGCDVDDPHTFYFVSRLQVSHGGSGQLRRWRKRLFAVLLNNMPSASRHFGLPVDRTVVLGSHLSL